jgi:hypothetical protein
MHDELILRSRNIDRIDASFSKLLNLNHVLEAYNNEV